MVNVALYPKTSSRCLLLVKSLKTDSISSCICHEHTSELTIVWRSRAWCEQPLLLHSCFGLTVVFDLRSDPQRITGQHRTAQRSAAEENVAC